LTAEDEITARIGTGLTLSQRGEREAARQLFSEIWDDIGPAGDPLHRCALAHSMADVQDQVEDELLWDLRALEAANLITDERSRQAGVSIPVSGFFPSLHLNLGDGYRKLGDLQSARDHLRRGRAAAGGLADDGYGRLVKKALDRLADRLQLL
jgi:hypothetical protein